VFRLLVVLVCVDGGIKPSHSLHVSTYPLCLFAPFDRELQNSAQRNEIFQVEHLPMAADFRGQIFYGCCISSDYET